MTRTPDEIKKGLECRIRSYKDICDHQCDTCDLRIPAYSIFERYEDALALIRWHEEKNEAMHAEIVRLQAERDAAVAGLKKAANEKGECFECKWYNGKNCTHQDYKTLCSSHDDKWEWRGVTKEE